MRVCFVSQQVDAIRTGVGTYARSLVPAVAAAGCEATLVARGRAPDWPGVAAHRVPDAGRDPTPEGWLSFAWAAGRAVTRLAAVRPFDLIHFLDAREALRARVPGTPVVGTAHDCYLADASPSLDYWRRRYSDWPRRFAYHRLARPLERRALRRLDAVIANSDYVRDVLIARYGLDPACCRTIHLGLPAPADAAAGEPPGEPLVLFIGANFQRKGLPALLRALARVRRTLPAARLLVVGDHPTRPAMEALAADLGLAEAVRFTGFVPHETVPDLYRRARVLALPSEVEGFGLTLLEAMQRGVPVVGSRVGGSAELVRDGAGGWLVAPGDVDALAARLEALLGDDRLWRETSAAARRAAAGFTVERMVAETLGRYREVVAARREVGA
jgi:glycosyltransferase involved in cell wall biosynthesis